MVSGSSRRMSFEEFLSTTADSPRDARNVLPPAEGYRAPSDALTVGAFFDSPILLDGYHRAVSFWRFADPDAVIDAYLPLGLTLIATLRRHE